MPLRLAGRAVSVSDQVARLHRAADALAGCLQALDPELYLLKLNGWSPRDILAHLVGWNRATIQGSEELRRGEVPFFDVDSGEDYSTINAGFVARYSATDLGELRQELQASVAELSAYLEGLDPHDWSRTWGVRHDDELLTIGGTIDELIEDYDNHIQQIDRWVAERAGE